MYDDCGGCADTFRDIEQQVEPLADAGIEVLADLFLRQRTTMNGGQAEGAFPEAVAGCFVAENQCKGILPVDERAARYRIGIASPVRR